MSLDINYYFEKPERFPVPGFLDDLKEPSEILMKAKEYLRTELVDKNVFENRGIVQGTEPNFHGCYFIGAGTVIYDGVTIIGPVYIGRDCEIMPGATIRPYTIIGDKCAVGHGAEIKHGVLFGGAKVASLAFVGDSVLGASARVGSGVITANRMFNQKNVTVKISGEKHDLGDTYFGAIIGDSARLGANCVTQPGTHIGPYTWLLPMTAVRGFIPREKRVYHPREIVMEENGITELQP